MDSVDRKLIVEAEKGLPLTSEPFSTLAAKVGVTPQEAISRLQKLRTEGVIRRFGVSLKPNSIGFNANALVAWKVPVDRVLEVAQYFSGCSQISHCYERETVTGRWEYNIYTVLHAHERRTVEQLIKQLSNETSLTDFLVLYSIRNLKNKPKETKNVKPH
jgi:DNA-binding Lrp family transcriptional regulator